MTNKDIDAKKVFESAESELLNKQTEILRQVFKELLQKREERQRQKERIEEEIRILNLDIEDLKSGKFDKIQERLNQSSVARGVSPVSKIDCMIDAVLGDRTSWPRVIPLTGNGHSQHNDPFWWNGTYVINCSDKNLGTWTKTFYF